MVVEFVVVITAQANAYLHALACFCQGLPCGRHLTRAKILPVSCVLCPAVLPDVSSTGNPPPLAGHQRTPTRHTLSHPARARGETFPCTRTLHLHQEIISLVQVDTKARMHQDCLTDCANCRKCICVVCQRRMCIGCVEVVLITSWSAPSTKSKASAPAVKDIIDNPFHSAGQLDNPFQSNVVKVIGKALHHQMEWPPSGSKVSPESVTQ